MTSTDTYEIELLPSNIPGAKDTMFRGGLEFKVREPRILELTDEQLEVFDNDWRFKVTNSTGTPESVAGGETAQSEGIPSADELAGEEAAEIKAETLEDIAVTQAEAVSSEDPGEITIEDLLKSFSRDELDLQAAELGVSNPENFNNKTEVAQAIVDAR